MWYSSATEITPLALDNSDRRYLVIYTPRAKDFKFYRKLGEWRDSGGVAAFYDYLLRYPRRLRSVRSGARYGRQARPHRHQPQEPGAVLAGLEDGEIDLPYRSVCGDTGLSGLPQVVPAHWRPVSVQAGYVHAHLAADRRDKRSAGPRKVMKLTEEAATERCMRMLLVTEPPADAQGVWAAECFSAFEHDLRRVRWRVSPVPGDGASGDQG